MQPNDPAPLRTRQNERRKNRLLSESQTGNKKGLV